MSLRVQNDPTRAKSRSFEAHHLGSIQADGYWARGAGDTNRPVWVMFGATPAGVEPVVANLRLGHPFYLDGSTYQTNELLRSAGYEYARQTVSEDVVVVTAYLPTLFQRDPGMVSAGDVRALVTLPAWWARARTVDPIVHRQTAGLVREGWHGEFVEHLAVMVPLVVEALDRRVRAPILAHPGYHFFLVVEALRAKLLDLPEGRRDTGNEPRTHRVKFVDHGTGLLEVMGITGTVEDWEAHLATTLATWRKRSSLWRT